MTHSSVIVGGPIACMLDFRCGVFIWALFCWKA